MDDKPDYNLLSEIMRNANMGWWEADLQSESYVCSEYISKLLGLKEDGFISFEDFNKRILKEEQPHTTIHSFDNIQQTNEAVYLLNTTKGPVWMRSKICMQKNEGKGNSKVYGIAEVQDGPTCRPPHNCCNNGNCFCTTSTKTCRWASSSTTCKVC